MKTDDKHFSAVTEPEKSVFVLKVQLLQSEKKVFADFWTTRLLGLFFSLDRNNKRMLVRRT